METKCFFQFKIIINGLVSSFRFIWIPMLRVYGINCLIILVLEPSLDVIFHRTTQYYPHNGEQSVRCGHSHNYDFVGSESVVKTEHVQL